MSVTGGTPHQVRTAHELPGSSARARAALGLLVLCAILLGALVAGTPVNLDDSHAARTAGINLTTPPQARAATQRIVEEHLAVPVIAMVLLSLAFGATAVLAVRRREELIDPHGGVDLQRASSRRGPPALV